MKRNLFILVALISATSLFAQRNGFSIYGGGEFPVGKWKDANVSPGFDVGVKYQYNLPVQGLGVFGTFDLMFNGLTKDGKASYNNFNKKSYDSYKLVTPKMLNFPMMAGVNYCYEFNNNIGIWGETALGLTVCKATDYKFNATYTNYNKKRVTSSTTMKTKAYANCAYQFGLGAIFWQHMSVGVHFYVFGGAKETKVTKTDVGANSRKTKTYTTELIPLSSFCIRIGYHF